MGSSFVKYFLGIVICIFLFGKQREVKGIGEGSFFVFCFEPVFLLRKLLGHQIFTSEVISHWFVIKFVNLVIIGRILK